MASVDNSHWIKMKNYQIQERKKLLDRNADIRRKIESPSFTDAQKITLRQDLKQNRNKIKTLDDQINEIESNISSKATNDILPTDTARGRSQTREPKHRYASPSPPQQSPRSVSSSSSRKKNHPTDDNTLGIMQRLLETYKAENARLKRRINSQESENQEKLREAEDKANYLQKEYDDMKAAYQRASLNEESLKWKLAELTRQNQDNKTSALEKMTQNQRIKDLQSMIEDRDSVEKRLRSNIKQQEAFHKKETDTIQQKLTELQKKFHLIQEERDNLRESEETERQIGEKAQQKLEDAKREKEKLQERIEELERETPAIKTEEFDSLNLTSATASHEFHTIFKREWMDAFKVLSNSGLQENDILLGLQGVLTKCVGDAVLECSEITKRVCRYRYFQTDPSPTLVKMLKLAGLKAVVPHKTKQMLENISTEDHGIPIPVPLAVKTYVQRCTEMTLLVRMLFPQLSIVADMESSHLNTQQFEVFSGEGNLIDVVVWPYIMKNGTVVQKGYVKVRSSKQTPSVSKNKEGATGISKSNDISDKEDHKYSDIEGTLIYKRDDEGKDESRNDTGSESANSMAESLTNYDLTSDFLNSFSIRQQRREDDVAGK